jgi:uncharacterized YceG family protein
VSGFRERTDEEREAAWREREARRAARGDAAPGGEPAVPSPEDEPAADLWSEPPPPSERAPLPEPDSPPQPERTALPEPDLPPEPEPDLPLEDLEDPPYDEAEHDEEYEVPSGTRAVSAAERPAPRRPRSGRAPRPRSAPRRRPWRGRLLAVLAFAGVIAVLWFAVELWQPFHGSAGAPVTVTIPPHLGSKAIGDLLANDGVVSSGFFFELRALISGQRSDLHPGTYQLQKNMTYSAALAALTKPPPPVRYTNLTIVEGRTRRQTAARLQADGIGGGYVAATVRSPLLDPRHYGAPAGTPSLEGFLFPSTYALRDPISMRALVDDQLNTFKANVANINLGYARSKHLSPYDVLIIASIVEAEAATAHDRPLVASVIYNRLKYHMALGMDSTTRYAVDNYTSPLTASQLASPSRYNTRVHTGLPPTPIDNPGLAAIQAAANPARTGYLYFVVKPCGNGASVFETNYQAFLADSARYHSARARRGGRSPSHC